MSPASRSAPGKPASVDPRVDRLGAMALRGLGAALGRLPRHLALEQAARMGRAWARLGGARSEVALSNLRIAFPEWEESQRRRVAVESFANLARAAVEFATAHHLDDSALRELGSLEGVEHAEAASRASPEGGVVVLTGHLGSWELLVSLMASYGYPVAVVHRSRDHPQLDRQVEAWRGARPGVELLPRGSAARGALRALKRGRFLAMPLDQNCHPSQGEFVPFFGRLACTRDAPVRIAMRTGAPVLPLFIQRIAGGARHRIRFEAPLPLVGEGELADPREAVLENLRRMTAVLEAAIRRSPSEWIWNHRRWRNPAPGEPRPYASRGRRRRSILLPTSLAAAERIG